MPLPLQLVAEIARIVRVLERAGLGDEAEKFMSVMRECAEVPVASTAEPAPPKRVRVRDDRTRALDAARSQKRRDAKRVGEPPNSNVTPIKSGVTRRDDWRDDSKGSPDLSKREEKRKGSDFRVISAESEIVEESGRVDPDARDGVTHGVTRRDDGVTDGARTPALSSWRVLQNEWVKLVHGGKRAGDPRLHRPHFESVYRDAFERCPGDPIGFALKHQATYITHKLSKGVTPEPRFFAADFAGWADKKSSNGAPIPDPRSAERKKLMVERREAEKAGDTKAVKEFDRRLWTLSQEIQNAGRF